PIMDHPQPPPVQQFSRFEVELEFVQCLANPDYLNYLAQMQYFDNPAFIAYLDYLEYFRRPEYTKMLTYPSYTLKALELVKSPAFRRDIVNPFFARTLAEDG
ncbi:mediator of RNA polymerase II transcription subunit 31, partial [Peziza echinospora]